jgi:hypothetical protein
VVAFQRFGLGLDELIHLDEQARKMVWESEIHGDCLVEHVPGDRQRLMTAAECVVP